MALTGFLINGGCYATSAQAIVALQAPYPLVSGTLIINAASATFAAPNTFNLSLATNSVNAATKTAATLKTMVIPMCDPAIPIPAGVTPFDPVVAAAFFTIALVFTVGIWMTAKQGGEILSVVKWW